MSAIRFDEFPLAEFIIKGTEGEDLDLENINGETALTMACRNGKLRFVELLLQVSLSLSLRLSLSLGLGLRGYISLLLVTLFTWSAALDSSDVLPLYSLTRIVIPVAYDRYTGHTGRNRYYDPSSITSLA